MSRRDRPGLRMKARADSFEHRIERRIAAGMTSDKVGLQIGIRKAQNCAKCVLLDSAQTIEIAFEKANQQHVELAHPAAAPPAQPRPVVPSTQLSSHRSREPGNNRYSVAPLGHQLLDLGNCAPGVQVLGTGLSTVQDRVATV